MKVIQPNCRLQFTAEDIDFIVRVLAGKANDLETLVQLLTDEQSRDLILDNERLYRALLELRGCLKVSTRFYFYILVRHVFRNAGIEDRAVADYVAEMLAEFSRDEPNPPLNSGRGGRFHYLYEMLAALENADDRVRFMIRAHIGNHSLFFTGIFPASIQSRAEIRGGPDLKYYEELGRSNFRMASDHRLAQRYDLAEIFNTLGTNFESTRRALNDMTERLLSIGDLDPGRFWQRW